MLATNANMSILPRQSIGWSDLLQHAFQGGCVSLPDAEIDFRE